MVKHVVDGGQLAVRNSSLLSVHNKEKEDFSSMSKFAVSVELVDFLVGILQMKDISELIQTFKKIPVNKLPKHQKDHYNSYLIRIWCKKDVVTISITEYHANIKFTNSGFLEQSGKFKNDFADYIVKFAESFKN